MSARKIPLPKKDTPGLSFEEALAKLQQVVASMEDEQLPLEELVNQYESGNLLLNHCEKALANARERIELITLSNSERDEGTTSKQAPAASAGDPDDDNDISLF